MKEDTAWSVTIDYEALGEAVGSKAKLARARGARSTISAAGFRHEFTVLKQDEALLLAKEVTDATGVSMRVDECVIFHF